MRNKTFPIKFIPLQGFTDTTKEHIEFITNDCASQIKILLSFIQCKATDHEIRKVLIELLAKLGARGLFTMFGMRKTVASQEIPWPSLQQMQNGFNRPNTVLSQEELIR